MQLLMSHETPPVAELQALEKRADAIAEEYGELDEANGARCSTSWRKSSTPAPATNARRSRSSRGRSPHGVAGARCPGALLPRAFEQRLTARHRVPVARTCRPYR